MKEGIVRLPHSVNWARYWSLVALAKFMGYTDLEVQTCPITIRVSDIVDGCRGVEMAGVCNGATFKAACTLTKQLDGSWLLNLVSLGTNKGFVALMPLRNPSFFPGYPKDSSNTVAD